MCRRSSLMGCRWLDARSRIPILLGARYSLLIWGRNQSWTRRKIVMRNSRCSLSSRVSRSRPSTAAQFPFASLLIVMNHHLSRRLVDAVGKNEIDFSAEPQQCVSNKEYLWIVETSSRPQLSRPERRSYLTSLRKRTRRRDRLLTSPCADIW